MAHSGELLEVESTHQRFSITPKIEEPIPSQETTYEAN
jgi:hypothetical protein